MASTPSVYTTSGEASSVRVRKDTQISTVFTVGKVAGEALSTRRTANWRFLWAVAIISTTTLGSTAKTRSASIVKIRAVCVVGKKAAIVGAAVLHPALEEAAVVLAPSGTVVVKGQLVLVPIVTGGGELHVPLDAGVRATVERS
jgi:hypothetical protein